MNVAFPYMSSRRHAWTTEHQVPCPLNYNYGFKHKVHTSEIQELSNPYLKQLEYMYFQL